MKNKKIFTGNYYICKKFAVILIVLIVFTGCGQNRITEKEEKKETVESEMNAEVKKTAQTFRSVYMKEKSELNTLKAKRKIINCLEEKGYAAVDCDNQIDMVNREKVEDFCKAAGTFAPAQHEYAVLHFHNFYFTKCRKNLACIIKFFFCYMFKKIFGQR